MCVHFVFFLKFDLNGCLSAVVGFLNAYKTMNQLNAVALIAAHNKKAYTHFSLVLTTCALEFLKKKLNLIIVVFFFKANTCIRTDNACWRSSRRRGTSMSR